MLETELYAPIKAFLEERGYEVKAEIDDCDVVARRGDEPPLIVELKATLNLELYLQAIDRQKITDAVYVAVPDDRRERGKKRNTLLRRATRDVMRLSRLLGVGLMVVRFEARRTRVEVLLDPGPYQPRKSPRKQKRLLREFATLRADYNVGGSRGARMTAYRQDALACAVFLEAHGVSRPAKVRDGTGVARAGRILYDNHYGWFEHPGPGEYGLSEKGGEALREFGPVVADLVAEREGTGDDQ